MIPPVDNGAPPGRARTCRLLGTQENRLARVIEAAGITVVGPERPADFVVAVGGDGALLGADRDFPHLPKVPLRRNSEVVKCPVHEDEAVFARIARGLQSVTILPRLEAEVRGRRIHCINDIVFHNARVTSGVRCRVRIDGDLYADEIVGDGIVASTPFGSSAYYRSITKSVIRTGLGLAFNNSTEAVNHLVLGTSAVVEIEVTRGPGLVVADNMLEPIQVDAGDVLTIRLAAHGAVVWELGALTCRDCRMRATGKPAGFRHV
jgi:NAD+ kinase